MSRPGLRELLKKKPQNSSVVSLLEPETKWQPKRDRQMHNRARAGHPYLLYLMKLQHWVQVPLHIWSGIWTSNLKPQTEDETSLGASTPGSSEQQALPRAFEGGAFGDLLGPFLESTGRSWFILHPSLIPGAGRNTFSNTADTPSTPWQLCTTGGRSVLKDRLQFRGECPLFFTPSLKTTGLGRETLERKTKGCYTTDRFQKWKSEAG